MAIAPQYAGDVEAILSHRQDLGADFWTTPDRRLIKGSPFSALNCAHMLLELGMPPEDPVLQGVAGLFFDAWCEDGRFKLYPTGAIYPCHTALAANLLCQMGHAGDPRLQKTLQTLLDSRWEDGGWRCAKYSFGRGPETEHATPMTTLTALDAFRHTDYLNREPALDEAVETLLWHWTVKMPVSPCHYGIGTLFMQVEYPFGAYNLFRYVHVLSFYDKAKKDPRFLEALAALQARTVDGQIVVERVVPKLARLEFCKKGRPSALATARYREILANLGREA